MQTANREDLKMRMVKTAARLWGVPENEIETGFDPLILLLLEAFAGELEKLEHKWQASGSRLLGRLAEFLLPDLLLGPVPASCVAQSFPATPAAWVEEHTAFGASQIQLAPSGESSGRQELCFVPIGRFPLLKVRLAFLVAGNSLFRCGKQKELVFKGPSTALSNELWLALEAGPGLTALDGLQLFFSTAQSGQEELFCQSLQQATAWLNGRQLEAGPGYYNGGQFHWEPAKALRKECCLNRQVAYLYGHRFFHICDQAPVVSSTLSDSWPFPKAVRKELEEKKYCFLQIRLDRHFPQEFLDGVSCWLNAFPVVNKEAKLVRHHTNEWINIVPLTAGEGLFFELERIQDEEGNSYTLGTEGEKDQFLIQRTGLGPETSNDIYRMVQGLSDAIRNRAAFFSGLGNEPVRERLEEAARILYGLEEKMGAAVSLQPETCFLVLRSWAAGQNLEVHFWCTRGEKAHELKAGTELTGPHSLFLEAKSSRLLTAPSGGRDGVSETERRTLLRRQLLSGGAIVSVEDIKLLCLQVFGPLLRKVVVKKGVQAGSGRTEGFHRSIDVVITCGGEADEAELQRRRRELEFRLQREASPLYPFRVELIRE